jgi:hypothetical protein
MIPELIALAAVPAVLGPALSALVKTLLSKRKLKDIEVEFQSGERMHLKVDADATEEQIRDFVKHDETVRARASVERSGA